MLVWMVRLPPQMFAWEVRRAPGMFARKVAIFGGEYLEIEQSIGEWNREIDQIIAKVHREFPKRTLNRLLPPLKAAVQACFAWLKALSGIGVTGTTSPAASPDPWCS